MEYGKFSSAEELMKGYTELEKSFTQKCQQLSALQKQLNETGGTSEISPPREAYARQTVANVNVDTVPSEGADSPSADGVTARNDDVLNRIRQYLDERGIAPDSLSDKEKKRRASQSYDGGRKRVYGAAVAPQNDKRSVGDGKRTI